jgi:hypothetical protein
VKYLRCPVIRSPKNWDGGALTEEFIEALDERLGSFCPFIDEAVEVE